MIYIKKFDEINWFLSKIKKSKPKSKERIDIETKIKEICNRYSIRNYSINSDESIDVNESVYLYGKYLSELPLKFNKVVGSFDCHNNLLTSLEGSPKSVSGNFLCYENRLTNLGGSPEEVGGDFWCHENRLNNLIGGPSNVGGRYWCYGNNLNSLLGSAIYIGGEFNYHLNDNLPYDIRVNSNNIKRILEKQDDYQIWNSDGSFNKGRFEQLMIEIQDEDIENNRK